MKKISVSYFVCLLLTSQVLMTMGHADDDHKFVGTIAVSKKDKKKYPDLAKISFQQVLEKITKDHPGKIVEVALEEEDGYLVYEVELISPEKTKKEIILDAGNGEVLHVKNKKDKKHD
jgi:uncharacterized membrane protein YkoI